MNENVPQVLWSIAGVLTLVLLGFAIRAGRRLRFLTDTPTSKAKGVFIGQVEITGRATLAPPVRSFLAGAETVWFRYAVEEEWSRWETETTTDSKGRTQTRLVHKTGWTTIDRGGEEPPFTVVDDTGSVLVRPGGAELEAVEVYDETVNRSQPLYFGKGPADEIADSNHRRRFREQAITNGATVFVAGRARERADVVAPEIAADKTADLFLISCRSGSKVEGSYRLHFWLLSTLALFPLPAVGWVNAYAAGLPPDWPLLAGLVFGVAALWALAWLWMSFNSLVQLRNRTEQGWSLVDVQLKRRADLIPRLVGVVSGLRDHEQRVQKEIAALRAQAEATAPWQPGPDVAAVQTTLRMVVERYPELVANEAFLDLQRELTDTETRVALARDYYNEIATQHNTRLEIVPDRWLAPLAGLKPRPLLTAESFERAPVTVQLARG